MATCVGGLATSHSPQLNTSPEIWEIRAEWDRDNPVFRFSDLMSRPDLPDLTEALTRSAMQERYDACQAALDKLYRTYLDLAPDVAVVIGDDQHEMFAGDVVPAVAVYAGDTIDDLPRPLESLHPSQVAGEWAYHGREPTTRPTHGALGRHLIEALTDDGFDITQIRSQPPEKSLGHAFTFIHRRIMRDHVVPMVPIMVNTDHVASAPRPRRCWDLGGAVRRAVESFAEDSRVLVVGSGGLSHFKVDEPLDRQVLGALAVSDVDALAALPSPELVLGTSEIRNWMVAAGALTDFTFDLVDYVAAYRSEAGTGCGMGFAVWRH